MCNICIVPVYIYIYTHSITYIHTYTDTQIHTYTHIYTHIHTYIHCIMYDNVYIYIHICICTHGKFYTILTGNAHFRQGFVHKSPSAPPSAAAPHTEDVSYGRGFR